MTTRMLVGRVALVTGAGPGIGRACALALADEGAAVAIAARQPDPLRTLADDIEQATGAAVHTEPTDIAELDQVAAMIDGTVAALGRIDVVVNVATYGGATTLVDDLDWDDYRRAVDVNVIGTMEVCRLAARRMVEQGDGGSIVNVSSISARTLMEGMARYTSTKGAMEIATKTFAAELGPHDVRANIVTPGLTTGAPLDAMFERMAEAQGRTSEEVSVRFARGAALRRHVDPADIAEAVRFLATPRSRNITGQEIQVSAGQHIA